MSIGTEKQVNKCPECGGDCAPECGKHPMGCVYGGFSEYTGYWIVVDGCNLNHEGTHPDGPMYSTLIQDKEAQ